MRSGHCWGSAGRRWLRRMTGCTPVHGNIQNATAKAWRASSELGYRQNRHQIWCSWVSTGQAWFNLIVKAQSWGDGRDTMLASRAFEHTEQSLIDRFKPAGQLDFAALAALPTLFVQETSH